MNIKQKILILVFALVASVGLTSLVVSPTYADCAGVKTSIIDCTQPGGNNADVTQSGIWGILLLVLNILTAGVGIAAVGGIVYASVLYTTASDSADQTKKAKTIIRDVIVGLIAYAGMYLLLNFLVPGGIFT
jgi:amino acid transporter